MKLYAAMRADVRALLEQRGESGTGYSEDSLRIVEAMVEAGIEPESAYYESLHEVPLIANTIARKKLYEMNAIISDTAEYGCYLFAHAAVPLLEDFMKTVGSDVIGEGFGCGSVSVDNRELVDVNYTIRNHPVEEIGEYLRDAMGNMKAL